MQLNLFVFYNCVLRFICWFEKSSIKLGTVGTKFEKHLCQKKLVLNCPGKALATGWRCAFGLCAVRRLARDLNRAGGRSATELAMSNGISRSTFDHTIIRLFSIQWFLAYLLPNRPFHSDALILSGVKNRGGGCLFFFFKCIFESQCCLLNASFIFSLNDDTETLTFEYFMTCLLPNSTSSFRYSGLDNNFPTKNFFNVGLSQSGLMSFVSNGINTTPASSAYLTEKGIMRSVSFTKEVHKREVSWRNVGKG